MVNVAIGIEGRWLFGKVYYLIAEWNCGKREVVQSNIKSLRKAKRIRKDWQAVMNDGRSRLASGNVGHSYANVI